MVKSSITGRICSAQEDDEKECATMSEEVKETMEDFASELEASYKEFDERRNPYQEQEGPDAEKWAELVQQMQDKAVLNVKVKEAVKGGLVTYVNDIQGFIPASQISTKYVEKLEDMVGQHLEVTPITVVPENKKLVLSGRAVMKQKEEEEKAAKMAAVEVGAVVEGTVDSLKDYGAFVNLDGGLSGLLHVSQISTQRIKHPGVVLKEGQKVTVKIIGIKDGKISLSMKALIEIPEEKEEEPDYELPESEEISTSLGSLFKNLKL